MRKGNKLLSLIVVTALIGTTVVGCGRGSGANSAAAGSKESMSTSSISSAAESKTENTSGETPTIQWYAVGATPDSEDRINTAATKMLRDAGINANFKIVWSSWDNYEKTISTMLASGEEFDMFNKDISSIDNFALSGGVHKITDQELKKYLPDVVSAMGDTIINGCRYNGTLYAVPVVHEYGQWFGVIYNSDIATKYNLDMSKVKSTSDFDALFAQLHKAAPDIYALYPDEEPFMVMADVDFVNRSNSLCVGMDLKDDSKGAFNYWESDKVVKWLKQLHEWYQKGYLVTDTTADASTMMNKEGTIFCTISRMKPGTAEQMSTQGQHFKQIAFNESSPVSTFCDYPGGWGVAISGTSKHPEVAMQVVNYAFKSADFINLLTMGEKDKDYTLSSDNIATIGKSGYGFDVYNSASWQMGNHYLNYVTSAQKDSGLGDIWTKLKKFNTDAKPVNHAGFYFDTAKYTTEISAIANTYKEYDSGLRFGSVDVDSTLKDFNDALKANGIQTIVDAVNAQYKEFLASKK